MAVFDALYAGHYDGFYAGKDYAAECDLVQQALARHGHGTPRTLLDMGCGTGGHAIELARRGLQVTGVDLSPAMLEQAAAKALPLGDRAPRWLCGDARDVDAGTTFDAAIMMFAVIGYLTGNRDVAAGLATIRRHLRPGAVFVCDFWYGPSVLVQRPTDRVRVLDLPDGGQVIRATQTTLDVAAHTADVSFTLWSMHGGGAVRQTHELHRLRYFYPQEFAYLLEQAGFELCSLSAFPSLEAPLDERCWNALAVARARP